ncbi:MAG: hypothetical protein Q9184_005992, partial [Pyrenodesmia sp. 2 TL-2023]
RRYFGDESKRVRGPKRSLTKVVTRNVYLDAVSYGETGLKAAVDAVGKDRVMFGTDHPFFPPLGEDKEEWLSVKTNMDAISKVFERDGSRRDQVLGGNAVMLLRLGDETFRR